MPSSARPGDTLHSDSVSYAVWLIGQSPRIDGSQVAGHILNRYPELSLGEAQHIQQQAQEQLTAGVALMALVPGVTLDDAQIPDSGRGGSRYRTQVDVTIPSRDGTQAHRTVIIEDDRSPTSDSVVDAIIEAINELCGQYDGIAREKCLEWIMGDVTVRNASISKGH